MKKITYIILILALMTSLPLDVVANNAKQGEFAAAPKNENPSGYNSEKEQFNLSNPSFDFKGSGQINQQVLRADGWLDLDDDGGDHLKMPVNDGLWIIVLVLTAYSIVIAYRRRKERI